VLAKDATCSKKFEFRMNYLDISWDVARLTLRLFGYLEFSWDAARVRLSFLVKFIVSLCATEKCSNPFVSGSVCDNRCHGIYEKFPATKTFLLTP
jgi:hypothetical protein